MNDVSTLARAICGDLVRSVARRGERDFIITRMKYPDGDSVNLYIERLGDTTYLSDLGTTLFKCRVNRVAMTDARWHLLESVCRAYEVQESEGELRKAITPDTVGIDCIRFCEAVTRISNLQYERDEREPTPVSAQLERLLTREVAPKRSVAKRWTHPVHDKRGDFPVDYHVNSFGEPRDIFFVGSTGKATLVAAVAGFLRLHDVYAPTLAIIDPDAVLTDHSLSRLERVTTEIRYGVVGREREIVSFALDVNKKTS